MTEIEFHPWPKTPRLFKNVVVTEKIDGTNGAIIITEEGTVHAQSRNRLITPEDDNFGFARWVSDNAHLLSMILGAGRHFGEWWGHGIQRGYDCKAGDRRFSLFNTSKWAHLKDHPVYPELPSLSVVPVLWTGPLDTSRVLDISDYLQRHGSIAKPGFDRPEGVCVYHTAASSVFKVVFDKPESKNVPDVLPLRQTITIEDVVKQMFGLAA